MTTASATASAKPDFTVAGLTRDFLIPLCAETAHLFRPVRLHPNDRLGVRYEASAKGNIGHFVCHAYQVDADGHEGYASWEAGSKWWERIPERTSVGNGYKVAATDFTALIINSVWTRNQLVFADELARLTFESLLMQFVAQAATVRAVASHKLNGDDETYTLIDHPALPLNKYQRVMNLSCYKRSGYGFFAEQGTGKTPPVIARICNEARSMREGEVVPDPTVPRKLNDARGQCEHDIEEKRHELAAAQIKKVEDEAKRLKAWAEERARQRTGELVVKGTAEEIIRETQKKLAEIAAQGTEDQAVVSHKLAEFKKAADSATKARLELYEAARRAALEVELKGIKSLSQATRAPGAKRMYRALIVAPKNVRVNWRNEISRFATTAGRVTIVRGDQIQRTKCLIEALTDDDPECEWTVVISSYDSVIRTWDAFKMVKWDLAVLDESHFIKDPATKRTKQFLELRETARQRMCLTGTPIANTLFDLWAQFEFMGEGWSGFSNYHAFKSFYAKYAKNKGRGGNKLTGYQNVPLIRERLARMAFMITKAEALPNLPQKMFDISEVEMSDEQAQAYEDIQTKLALEIENDLASGDPRRMVVTNILTKMLRLAQVTSGFVSWDAVCSDDGEELVPRSISAFNPNPKVEALIETLKEKGPDDKTLVWACWIQDVKVISERLTSEGIKHVTYTGATSDVAREEAQRQFNDDPECKVFIGNAAAGGVGLNLLGYDYWNACPMRTTNANHVIYFSQNWSMTHRSQSEDRAHRNGTRVPVRYTDLCVPGTIDEEIRARVVDKKITATTIQDVRDIMNLVLGRKTERDE